MAGDLEKKWVSREEKLEKEDVEQAQAVIDAIMSGNPYLDPLIARLLYLRGISSAEQAQNFLHGNLSSLPCPDEMKGMKKAAARIADAVINKEKISIHSDFDCDGITSAACLMTFFKMLGANASYSIPSREEGYGLSEEAIRQCAAEGTRLIISTDCGITAHKEAEIAHSLGVTLLVTDHHRPPDTLPKAYSIINPHQHDCPFPFKDLAGVGVAFFLAGAIRRELRQRGWFEGQAEPPLKPLLPFLAIGTIADLVPLKGINRVLVEAGLGVLQTNPPIGFSALCQAAGVKKISCGSIAFNIAPRLNASGRLESASLGVELLLTQDEQQAQSIARQLDALNRERQRIEDLTLEKAIRRIDQGETGQRTIVLADPTFHPGVIGICCSRLIEKYHRPSILIALDQDQGKGSGRSITNFHLYDSLKQCSEFLDGFGGHKAAAGLKIQRKNIAAFAHAFDDLALSSLSEEDMIPRAFYDDHLPLEMCTVERAAGLELLQPHGMENPTPCFICKQVTADNVRVVGEKHLSFIAQQNGSRVRCIAFGMAQRAQEIQQGSFDILFSLGINEWRGERSAQLEIKDIKKG
ncbi:single-stranded-DNA-specific exonuclease RecJ [Geoalkalibacter subterraneus]|uniref:Single-stranded-DNA-specific exonuclease RecJ n=1 Tax=Geoalkalibacter subterraneus TaxID=483547 RepID=A0A0B5FL72_9BACT|nr:single-stranded-DNA-specific exonuclease RecJ [Geoalkalibacter subterraneus]AJF08143.1 hypothetical protein GSUB_16690 [Geoalkalibacter subterraneus]